MTRFVAAFLAVVLGTVTLAGARGGAHAQAADPPLPEPEAVLNAALHCPPNLGRTPRGPVLLVPGTGLSGPENWDWGYRPALEAEGFAVCTVDMADLGLGDVQVSAGRVVHAVRVMAAATGQQVALVGYSQGGLNIRWALKFWPGVRPLVSEVIGLAPANHGADSAAAICQAAGACPASIWQMVPGSRLLRALDAGGETFAGIDYTVLYSREDGVVVPPAARSGLKAAPGAQVANIEIQGLCPASRLTHIEFPADGAVFALVLDALRRPGPADSTRVSPAVCGSLVPGVDAATAAAKAQELTGLATGRIFAAPMLPAEPPLAPYAAGSASPTPRPPATGSDGAVSGSAAHRLPLVAAAAALLVVGAALGGAAALRPQRGRSSSM